MRYAVLLFLAAGCLMLTGCSHWPSRATGPQGGGEPLPLGGDEPLPRHALPQPRPMSRRRRNALMGRPVSPSDSSACGGACGCGSCGYPLWLYEAQSKEGLYLGFDFAAARAEHETGFAPPLKFFRFAAEASEAPAVFSPAARGALFADYCLAQAVNPKTGRGYPRLGQGVARAENWLHYGAAAQPCFGALMVAEEDGRYELAFCVGALTLPHFASARFGGGRKDGAARGETLYLGLGVKNAAAGAGQIGLTAFAASAVRGFRLPQNYRPCKEHFKLDYSFWTEQFRAQLAEKQSLIAMAEPERTAPGRTGFAALPPAGGAGSGGAYAPQAEDREFAAALERDLAAQDFSAPPAEDWGLAAALERDLAAQDFSAPPAFRQDGQSGYGGADPAQNRRGGGADFPGRRRYL